MKNWFGGKMAKLSEQLTELMQEDGINQKELAEKLNTSHSKISLYLNDKCLPTYGNFVLLLEFFNCSADFLAGKTDFPNRDKKYLPAKPFGKRLISILNDSGISKNYFHKTCNVSWSILHHWFNGTSQPSVDNLIKIANFLECSIDFILGRET